MAEPYPCCLADYDARAVICTPNQSLPAQRFPPRLPQGLGCPPTPCVKGRHVSSTDAPMRIPAPMVAAGWISIPNISEVRLCKKDAEEVCPLRHNTFAQRYSWRPWKPL